jgi:methionine-rich copper-binding protein CopC
MFRMLGETPLQRRLGALLVANLALGLAVAEAGPRHVSSSVPAAEAIIEGDHAEYVVRFDGPVDHESSRMEITQSGRVIEPLTLLLDSAPEVLFASARSPASGHYQLHWQVRSPEDGVISSGDIPFSVAR